MPLARSSVHATLRSRHHSHGSAASSLVLLAGVLAGLLATAMPAAAVDGVIEINQASALSGIGGADAPGFPVTISEAGAYRLTSNLAPAVGPVDVIEVTASSVSLDLNGFALQGGSVCVSAAAPTYVSCTPGGAADRGVFVGTGLRDVRIANGAISGMMSSGVQASGARVVLSDLSLVSNAADGAYADSADATRVTAMLNAGAGIAVALEARYRDITARRNGGTGIMALSTSMLENVAAHENAGNGIQVGTASTVIHAVSTLNGMAGLTTTGPTIVRNVLALANTTFGIAGGSGTLIENSTATNNTLDGIFCSTNCIIRNNVASLNTGGGATTDGIDAGLNAVVFGNNANSNQGAGLRLGAGTLYDENHMSGNPTNVTGGVSMGTNVCGGAQC